MKTAKTALCILLTASIASADVQDAGSVQSPDAGTYVPNFSDPLYSTCPADSTIDDVQLDGGAFWIAPDLRVRRNACLMATCDVDRQMLRDSPPLFSTSAWVVGIIGLVLGAVLGAYVGWSVSGFVHK